MRALIRFVAPLAALLTFPPAASTEPPARAVHGLFEDIARASGIDDPEARSRHESDFDRLADAVRARVRGIDSERRRARRAMQYLYFHVFRAYRADADGIHDVLDRGEYNCVSGTLVAGLVARSIGLEARVLAGPRHLVLRLRVDGRSRDVDTTADRLPTYFGVPPASLPEDDSRMWLGRAIPRVREVSLEEAVSFLWYNRAQRALDRGRGLESARAFHEAWTLNPDPSDDPESLAGALARAFRLEYETGAFAAALDVAAIDLSIFPGRTTATDRLQAAALKRIEALAESGDPGSAEDVLDDSLALVSPGSDRARLERAVCPIVVRTSVRLGDWERARRMASRFAQAEPDLVEGERLVAWVVERQRAASAPRD